MDPNLSIHRMAQIVGSIGGERSSRPRIDFRLESHGQATSVERTRGDFFGKTVGFDLASFEAVRGESYTLTADVREVEPDLRIVNGHLLIRIPHLAAECFRFRVLAARLLAIITVVVALFVFSIQAAYSRGSRHVAERTLRKRSYIVFTLLLVAALAVWFLSSWVAQRFTTPLHHAFPIVAGEHASLSFVPKLSERHYIEIELERNLPFPRLQQIIGSPLIGEEPPPSRPNIDFRVESRGQRVEIQPERSQHWGKLVGFTLGSFMATRGETYALIADVIAAEPDLRTLNGKLFVNVHPMTGQQFYVGVLETRLLAVITAIVTLFVFLLRVAHSRGTRISKTYDSELHGDDRNGLKSDTLSG